MSRPPSPSRVCKAREYTTRGGWRILGVRLAPGTKRTPRAHARPALTARPERCAPPGRGVVMRSSLAGLALVAAFAGPALADPVFRGPELYDGAWNTTRAWSDWAAGPNDRSRGSF